MVKKSTIFNYLSKNRLRRLLLPFIAICLIINANIDRNKSSRIQAFPSEDEANQACENWKATLRPGVKLNGWTLDYIACLRQSESRQFAGVLIKDKTFRKFKDKSEKNWDKCITISTDLQIKKPIPSGIFKTIYRCSSTEDGLKINIRESLAEKYFRY
tara:strand:- start:92 stop:565 length:474 start_codon:yes stop_codon:yes gene_type:complete